MTDQERLVVRALSAAVSPATGDSDKYQHVLDHTPSLEVLVLLGLRS